jgi:hypothetical protein
MGTEPGNTSNPSLTNSRVWLFNADAESSNSTLRIFRTNALDTANGLVLAGAEGAIYAETKGGFRKVGKTDTDILLAGGGTKVLTDFVQRVHNSYLSINPSEAETNFNQGLRINKHATTGYSLITLGGAINSTAGKDANTWVILTKTTDLAGDGALKISLNSEKGVEGIGMTLTNTGILQVKGLEIVRPTSSDNVSNNKINNKNVSKNEFEKIDLFGLINSKINKKEFDEFKSIQLKEISDTMYKKELQLLEQHKILIKQNKSDLIKENENLINRTIQEKNNQIDTLIKENNILKDKIDILIKENKENKDKKEFDNNLNLERKYKELEEKLNELYGRFNQYL